MKKVFSLVALFIIGTMIGTSVQAQNSIALNAAKSAQTCAAVTDDGFTATFSFSSINAAEVSTEKGTFSNITMENTYPTGMLGEPTLPAVNKLLAIPYGANDVTVEVKSYSTEVYALNDFGINRLYPQQPLLKKDQKPGSLPFAYNEEAYARRGFAERPIAEVAIQGTMRGIQVGALTVNPVQYDPATNSIRVYNNIEVEVSYGSYDHVASYDEFARTFSPYFAGIYRQMFNWRDDVYDEHPDLWQNPVKMLVIANRMFEECMQEWVAWKTTKGIHVDLNFTDNIGSNASAIRTFIQGKYAEDAPTFVMIFGDKDQVPASATGSNTQCVTDLYYMSVDSDEFADMFHSRFPAETVAQMEAMLEKALEYEQLTMPDPSYIGNVLLIAGEDSGWGVTVGRPTIWYASNYYYNAEHGLNNVYEYSHGTYTGCYDNFNTGVGFANYTAHGSNTSWSGPSFTVSNVNSLTNIHKYFLAMGNCCQAADWGINGPCFGEAMVRAEKKAAYAYIGSCPSTYWLNDYYFGVGATSIANGTMPTYEQTTMGCYDAIWMDDAYNTVCAIPYVGNLASNAAQALGYTLHINTLYCWQAYHVLGDGSIIPFRTVPTNNTVSHLPTLPIGVNFYNVTADPGSFVSITKDGVIYGTGMIGSEGVADIAIEPITSGGDVTICITHPQRIPYIATVPAAALDGAYMTYNDYEALRPLIAGAWIPMNLSIKNVGTQPASNIALTVSTESQYVNFIHNEATVENVNPEEVFVIEDAIDFDLDVNIPNGEKIIFFVTMTDGTDTWESRFNFTVGAPSLEFGSITSTGLEPGATGTITLQINNNGAADTQNAQFEIFSCSSDLTFENNVMEVGILEAGRGITLDIPVQVNEAVAIGSTYELSYRVNDGHYSAEGTYTITVGNIVEDFETGDFSAYDWNSPSSTPWTITSTGAHSGTYCAKSGAITDNMSTDLVMTVEVLANGQLSFFRKVSSENSYDKLYFYIDNQQMNNWSGDQGWEEITYDVTAGNHTFKWSYQKDYSVSSGSDCAWIDDIKLPPTNVVTFVQPVTSLEATAEGNEVNLVWRGYKAVSYEVRRNGELVGTTEETAYSDIVPEDGIYTYSVTAIDEQGLNSVPCYVTINVGLVNVEENHAEIAVYPNPVKDELNIRVNADFTYAVFNNMGQEVMHGSSSDSVRLSGLTSGMYFVRISTGNEVHVSKIIVE